MKDLKNHLSSEDLKDLSYIKDLLNLEDTLIVYEGNTPIFKIERVDSQDIKFVSSQMALSLFDEIVTEFEETFNELAN